MCQQICHPLDGFIDSRPRAVGELLSRVASIEAATGATLGDARNPLLLSVRCGADGPQTRYLGMTDGVVEALAASVELEDAAWDAYRRFLESFGPNVLGIPRSCFDAELIAIKNARGMLNDVEATDDDWKEVVYRYKEMYRHYGFGDLFNDPQAQLLIALAVAIESGVVLTLEVQHLTSRGG